MLKGMAFAGWVLFSAATHAESEVARALRQCEASPKLSDNEAMSPSQMEAFVAAAKSKREKDCEAFQKALTVAQEKNNRLSAAAAQVSEALQVPWRDASAQVDINLDLLKTSLLQMRAIPNDPTDANNLLFRDAESLLVNASEQTHVLATGWDSRFKAVAGGPVDQIRQTATDPYLPEAARGALQAYLNKLPPYVLGDGPAPREKLQFLQIQMALVKKALVLKNERYIRGLIDQETLTLQEQVEPGKLAAKAARLRIAVLKVFSFYDKKWSTLAVASGACSLAKEKLAEQVLTLQKSIELSPQFLKPSLTQAVQGDIDERQQTISSIECSPSKTTDMLSKSLKRWQNTLPTFCKSTSPGVAQDLAGLLGNVEQFLIAAPQMSTDEDKVTMTMIGEELWSRGYFLLTTCRGAQ